MAGAAAVVTFLVALAVAQRDVRERSLDARAVAPARRVRTVARSLERLARLAESGAAEPRQTRPPRSVLELAPEAAAIRELATLLRAHPEPPAAALAACDRFVFHAWNAGLRGLDHELLRRELGRARFVIKNQPSVTRRPVAAAVRTASMVRAWPTASASPRRGGCSPATAPAKSSSSQP